MDESVKGQGKPIIVLLSIFLCDLVSVVSTGLARLLSARVMRSTQLPLAMCKQHEKKMIGAHNLGSPCRMKLLVHEDDTHIGLSLLPVRESSWERNSCKGQWEGGKGWWMRKWTENMDLLAFWCVVDEIGCIGASFSHTKNALDKLASFYLCSLFPLGLFTLVIPVLYSGTSRLYTSHYTSMLEFMHFF